MDLPFDHLYMYSSAFRQEKGRNVQTFLPTVVPFLETKNTRWRHWEYPALDLQVYHSTSHFLYCWFNENVSLPLTEFLYPLHACLFWKCMQFSLDFHSSEAHYLWNYITCAFGLCLDSNASTFEFCTPKDQFTNLVSLNRSDIRWNRVGSKTNLLVSTPCQWSQPCCRNTLFLELPLA
jgi:hypothetical protein